eukprot:gene3059-5993_t
MNPAQGYSRGRLIIMSSNPTIKIPATSLNRKPADYFIRCGLAGAISCSFSHSLLVPVDVVKTRMQTDVKLRSLNAFEACKRIVTEGGPQMLIQGLGATYSGYLMQGACKFGFYEFLKSYLSNLFTSFNINAKRFHLLILLISSATAEVIASWALCPLETTRIHLVTNPAMRGLSLIATMSSIVQTGGLAALFKGLPLILLRQIPYTCTKLVGYEIISEALLEFKNYKLSSNNSTSTSSSPLNDNKVQDKGTLIPLFSGIAAGILAAIVSHPADFLLSKSCGSGFTVGAKAFPHIGCSWAGLKAATQIVREMGIIECYTGVAPRALMVGTVTAIQFFVYEKLESHVDNGNTTVVTYPILKSDILETYVASTSTLDITLNSAIEQYLQLAVELGLLLTAKFHLIGRPCSSSFAILAIFLTYLHPFPRSEFRLIPSSLRATSRTIENILNFKVKICAILFLSVGVRYAKLF